MQFYEMIGKYYDVLFPSNEKQVTFLKKQAASPLEVLDIGCATGGYALKMAEAGHRVTAIDLDPDMIEQFEKKNSAAYLSIDIRCLDMKAVKSLGKKFDLIYCIGNTLVHLENLETVNQFMKDVYECLNDGGKFVLQTVNYDRILNEQIQSLKTIERREENLSFERRYERTTEGLRFIGHLTKGELHLSAETNLLPILKSDVKQSFISAGFREFGIYGDFEEHVFDNASEALVAIAIK